MMNENNTHTSALRKQAEQEIEKGQVKTEAPPAFEAALACEAPLAFEAPLSAEEVQQLLHELHVHQIELELQNEELRRAQLALEASRERYFDLFNLAPVGYLTINKKGLILESNLTASDLLGVKRSALNKRLLSSFIVPEDQDILYRRCKQLFETHSTSPGQAGAPRDCELRLKRADGAQLWVRVNASAAQDSDGTTVCRVVLSDIRESKQAAEELRQSEEKYRTLFSEMVAGCALHEIIRDDAGKVVDYVTIEVNTAFESLLDTPRRMVIGKKASEILPQEELNHWLGIFGPVAQTGKTTHYDMYSPLNGKYFEGTAYCPEKGKFAVTFTDITERKQTEEALRASLAEKDILLKEVHHRVKNNLASIASLIGLQQETLSDPNAIAELNELSGRIHSMALVHELLYQSETLSQVDLQEYLTTLVVRLRASYDPHASIQLNVAADGVLMNLDSAIPCGLMVNELVTNAFKYAFPDGKARPGEESCTITITATRDRHGYTLIVGDNGIGLLGDLDWAASPSLGLQLVKMLGQHQLGGQIEVDCSAGTRFRLRFTP